MNTHFKKLMQCLSDFEAVRSSAGELSVLEASKIKIADAVLDWFGAEKNFEHPPLNGFDPGPTKRFTPPKREEVLFQAAKIGLPESEALKFLAYYDAKGWLVGKSPMQRWASALSGWKLRWEERRPASESSNPFDRTSL